MTCRNAQVALRRTTETSRKMVIIIGGFANTRCLILKYLYNTCNSPQTLVTTGCTELDCNTYKSFWIAWNDNQIRVGRGATINDDIIMQYTDSSQLSFDVMTINACDYGDAFAKWTIPGESNDIYSVLLMILHLILWNTLVLLPNLADTFIRSLSIGRCPMGVTFVCLPVRQHFYVTGVHAVWWHSFYLSKSTIVRYFVRNSSNLLSVVFQ